LRSNQPVLDLVLTSVTQYIWRPGLSLNDAEGQDPKFIWTIQTLDASGAPLVQTEGNGESRSEPFVFTIKMHR